MKGFRIVAKKADNKVKYLHIHSLKDTEILHPAANDLRYEPVNFMQMFSTVLAPLKGKH
jgi:hypothetical protein